MFNALRRHFTSSYDYVKYHGKIKADPNKFLTRKDAYQYQRLSRITDLQEYLISNFLNNPKTWVTDLSDDVHTNRLKRLQSLSYNFRNEIKLIVHSLNDYIKYSNNTPELLRLYRFKKISMETLIILNEVFGIFEYWNKVLPDKTIWPKEYLLLNKYRPFLTFDKNVYKSIIKEELANK